MQLISYGHHGLNGRIIIFIFYQSGEVVTQPFQAKYLTEVSQVCTYVYVHTYVCITKFVSIICTMICINIHTYT